MKILIEQTFPLGRFHATPWKVFPYDDPHGEWPPSPWRLLRAVIARSFQLERETGTVQEEDRANLVRTFAQSSLSWRLPDFTWRGPGLRQYQPAEFKKVPAAANLPGEMTYNTTKVQDNFWLTSERPLIWHLEGENWNEKTIRLLSACLDRMIYFGRAEAITFMRIIQCSDHESKTNCSLSDVRTELSVPVLCPKTDATLQQVLMTTDEKPVAEATTPPGATWKFAIRPERPPAKARPMMPRRTKTPIRVLQFAIGSHVPPPLDSTAILINWYRGRVVRKFLGKSWLHAKQAGDLQALEAVSGLSGKDAEGKILQGHQHVYYALWPDPATNQPARLIAWRSKDFKDSELAALLAAAQPPLSLGYNRSKDDDRRNPWTIHLIPLDSCVSIPAGFDSRQRFNVWRSVTPYVPPRHVFDRKGRVKAGESVEEQIAMEVRNLGLPECKVAKDSEDRWIKVHQSKNEGNSSNTSKRGFYLSLHFQEPVAGPLALGLSSHYGLGLFVPIG